MVPGLVSYPHTTPDRFLIGGPSNAGALFVDWARHLLRGVPATRARTRAARTAARRSRPGPGVAALRAGRAHAVRGPHVALEPLRARHRLGCRRPSSEQPSRRAASSSGACSSAGVKATRIVASGGGSRVTAWMAAVADATGLPVDTVAVPEGAAWAPPTSPAWPPGSRRRWTTRPAGPRVGRRIEPDPAWVQAPPRRATGAVQRAGHRAPEAGRLPVGGEGHLEGAAAVLARPAP